MIFLFIILIIIILFSNFCWYHYSLDLKEKIEIKIKANEYTEGFYNSIYTEYYKLIAKYNSLIKELPED